ncbi:glutamate racemase [Candidatus Schneideria nysicola]|uniref:glutamate racemase n=1 Tax=Candidatus Schneideria nysicola TaxID=1081631 RepID=UPI001CAA73A7|nr:glutamate racemase [Candidatus Schneideria nysicola]UAJ66297.1 glutamate racemase [Candidatus Schneideria nysicola]
MNTSVFFQKKNKKPTIMILDSGMGGLSTYIQVNKFIKNSHYLYVFDNEGFPYGEKTDQFIIERINSIIQAIQRLHNIDILILACNTVSTINNIKYKLHPYFSYPIMRVIPNIKSATQYTKNKIIGIIATQATINRRYIIQLTKKYSSKDYNFLLLGSSKLVELAEFKLRGGLTPLSFIKEILLPWLKINNKPDTIIMGCTHFPLLLQEFQSIFPNTLFLDPSIPLAKKVYLFIEKYFDCSEKKDGEDKQKNIAYCISLTDKVISILPILKHYGFSHVRELFLWS